MMDNGPSIADIAAVTDGNRSGGFGGFGDGWAVVLLFFLAMMGWGNRGFGGNGGGTFDGAIPNGFALATDYSTLERKMDSLGNGMCDGFYSTAQGMNTGFAGVQNAMCQGFAGINQAVTNQGYETRLGIQGMQAQAQQCCCDTLGAIKDGTTQGIMNTNAIQQQLAQCCCDAQKDSMQTRFDSQQQHAETMQAIGKVGDRIENLLTQQETQRLRDENAVLRGQVDRAAQNRYLTDTLRPCPQPAYVTCNPWATNGTCYSSCC